MNETRRHAAPSSPQHGFTLPQLLVVMVIIGLLAYVRPRHFAQLGKSEVTVARVQIEALVKAVDAYYLDVGRYPLEAESLNALLVKPAAVTRWNGPYLQKAMPLDLWGAPYVYRFPGTRSNYEVGSESFRFMAV